MVASQESCGRPAALRPREEWPSIFPRHKSRKPARRGSRKRGLSGERTLLRANGCWQPLCARR